MTPVRIPDVAYISVTFFFPPCRVSTLWLSSSKWIARGGRRFRCVHFCAMHSQCLPKTVIATPRVRKKGSTRTLDKDVKYWPSYHWPRFLTRKGGESFMPFFRQTSDNAIIAVTKGKRVVLCFINSRVRKIRNEASSCPGIFSRTLRVLLLLFFMKPILGNRYLRSRGFIVSEPRETHPRSEIADVPTSPCPPFDNLGCVALFY